MMDSFRYLGDEFTGRGDYLKLCQERVQKSKILWDNHRIDIYIYIYLVSTTSNVGGECGDK